MSKTKTTNPSEGVSTQTSETNQSTEQILNELQSMDIEWLFELDDFITLVKEQKINDKTKDEFEWKEVIGDYLYSVRNNLYQEDPSQGQWIDRYDLYDEIKELYHERLYDELEEQSELVLDCLDRGGVMKEDIKGIINDDFTEWKMSITDLKQVSIDRLYEIEDKLLILRDDSFGQLREEYEEILFDVRMIRKLRS